eukprot:Gb_33411 [translate_table: standard]
MAAVTDSVCLSPTHLQHGSLLPTELISFHKEFLKQNISIPKAPRSVKVTAKALKHQLNENIYWDSPLKLWKYTQFVEPHVFCRGVDVDTSASSNIVLKELSREKPKSSTNVSRLLNLMDQQSIRVDSNAYARLLQVCVKNDNVRDGRRVHAHIIKTGFEPDVYLDNNLISMYAKLKTLVDARQVFDRMPQRNMVSWTAMISAYAKSGHGEDALRLFRQMQRTGVQPNEFTFTIVLGACIGSMDIEQGKQVQVHIIKTGSESCVNVSNVLVDMYAKCGNIENARQVFDKMHKRDMVSWNTMTAGYCHHGFGEDALEIFCEMQRAGIKQGQFALSSVLVATAILSALEVGKHVHAHIVKTGFESNVTVNNALVTMYAKCGDIEYASQVFIKMPQRDVISWTGMIAGYSQHGQVKAAVQLFQQMPEQNSVSCSAMIAAFAQNGQGEEALKLFREMQHTSIHSTHFTFASVLNACADLAVAEKGRQMHGHIIKTGFESCLCIGSALADMYAKCSVMVDAQKVFDTMPWRNTIMWTGMITGYAQNGQGEVALNLFCEMQRDDVRVDRFTLASVLGACGTLGALEQGKLNHSWILKTGLGLDIGVSNALLTMYAKCGSIKDARVVFDEMPERDIVSWNAMIAGYAQHGLGKEALQLFPQMRQAGLEPNDITFVGVLSACKHVASVDESRNYFDSMTRDYGIIPRVEHYACMVDILGRVARLEEAENFINEMPFEPSALVWRTLLGACRFHCNIEMAKRAAEWIIELEPQDPATCVLVANIYASVGWWDDAAKVRRFMKDRGLKKLPARSWIVDKNRVHSFVVRDRSHPQTEEIHAKLTELVREAKDTGYIPDTSYVLHDAEQHQKEHFLIYHSEKLAIAFGLLTTSPGTPIRIIKSIRVCGDCHTFTKFISKTVAREIILRDASCFHYFKDGYCSCGDYW